LGWFFNPSAIFASSPTRKKCVPSNRRRASATPANITANPSSPPIASMAIQELVVTRQSPLNGPRSTFDRDDLTAIIMAARRAEIVRTLELAAIRALLERLDRERIVRAAHATAGGRGFLLGNGHCGDNLQISN
jgi:hypothetical protein